MTLLLGRISTGILSLALAGCGESGRPLTPSPVQQPLPPAYVAPQLLTVTLSGVVTEQTPTGLTPISDVDVYCEACGEGHVFDVTDSTGSYGFEGVWVVPGTTTQLIVWKPGYAVVGATMTFSNGSGMTHVMVDGDTRFDIQLVRN